MERYTLTLDKERSLIYSNRSFRELEKLSGNKPILAELAELFNCKDEAERNQKMMEKFFSSQFLTNFVYVGLLHEPEMSLNKVVDIIPVKEYLNLMTFALNVIMTEFGLVSKDEATVGEKKSLTENIGTGTMPS